MAGFVTPAGGAVDISALALQATSLLVKAQTDKLAGAAPL